MAKAPTHPHPVPSRSTPEGLPLHGGQFRLTWNKAGGGGEYSEGVGGSRPPPLRDISSPLSARRSTGKEQAAGRREGKGGEGRSRSRVAHILAVLGAVTALGLWVGPVLAQEPTPSDDEVNAIARGLYCPVCENVPLDVCPTQACEQWRATIREKLALGWTEDEIKAYFVAQYGDRVLASPPARGFNWLVYVLPPLVILAAGVFLWQTMRRWRVPIAEPGESAEPQEQDPYVQRMEEELRRRG